MKLLCPNRTALSLALLLLANSTAAQSVADLLKSGNEHREARNYDRAIADYTKAIELAPEFALAYENRGRARRAKGDRLGAMDDFDQALQLKSRQRTTPPRPVFAEPKGLQPRPNQGHQSGLRRSHC